MVLYGCCSCFCTHAHAHLSLPTGPVGVSLGLGCCVLSLCLVLTGMTVMMIMLPPCARSACPILTYNMQGMRVSVKHSVPLSLLCNGL